MENVPRNLGVCRFDSCRVQNQFDMNHNAAKSNLAERLIPIRASMREQNRILRRARRLYILICRRELTTSEKLNFCARRMLDAGLYANATPLRGVRYSILRAKWKLEVGRDWHRWIRDNGWSFYSFEKQVAA